MMKGLLRSILVGLNLQLLDYQAVPLSNTINLVVDSIGVKHQQECIGDELIHIYCKGNNLYSMDNCGLEELYLNCFEARCYRGDCVDEAQ